MPIRVPRDPPVVEVGLERVLWRVHRLEREPLWFGPGQGNPPRNRFDAPDGAFGVCYFADSLGAAVLETLVRGRTCPLITRADLAARGGSAHGVAAPLRMLQLEGPGLSSFAVGADAVMGTSYEATREIAADVHARFGEVDGIQYRSRWDSGAVCWAVFERARERVGGLVRTHPLGDPAVVVPALRPYRHVGVL